MTDHLNAAGDLLRASVDERTLTYRLLPYGEEGRTNLGKVVASKGSVTIPEDPSQVTLNIEHEYKRPVGRAVNITEDEDGLTATFRVAQTSAGDDLLAEAQEGLRASVSVEIDSPVIRAGRLVSGLLTAAGAVVRPAFPSALLVAEDFGDLEEEEDTQVSEAAAEDESAEDEESEAENLEKDSDTMENTAVPTGLNAADNSAAAPELNAKTVAQAFATRDTRLAASLVDGRTANDTLNAAFAGTTYSANKANVDPGQWVGELWSGKTYSRRYADLVASGALTSYKVEGWKWSARPTVAEWAGDLAEIHSSVATTEPYSVNAQYLAGGFKVSREYVDLGSPEFIQGMYTAAAEDYARKSDLKVLAAIQANATPVEGGSVPTGVNSTMARIVDGVIEMIDFATPSFALVSTDLYRDVLLTRNDDSLKYLSSALGFEEGSVGGFRLLPSADLAAGTVIVGAKEAVQFFELPGSPIRVSAIDVQHGAFDEAVHGYYAIVVHDERGLVSVTSADEA